MEFCYGVTPFGGNYSKGVIYRFDPTTSNYTKLYDFVPSLGNNPTGVLLESDNGKLYGLTKFGGENNDGILFRFDPVTEETTILLNFANTSGSIPVGSLIQAANGMLYGVTEGNANGVSEVFTYNIGLNEYTSIHELSFENGFSPSGRASGSK